MNSNDYVFKELVRIANVEDGEDAAFSDLLLMNDEQFNFVYGWHRRVCKCASGCIFYDAKRKREGQYV